MMRCKNRRAADCRLSLSQESRLKSSPKAKISEDAASAFTRRVGIHQEGGGARR